MSGSSSAVERQLPKLDVAGSIPVSRSSLFNLGFFADSASSVKEFYLVNSSFEVVHARTNL